MSKAVSITMNFSTASARTGGGEVSKVFTGMRTEARRTGQEITKALNVRTEGLVRNLGQVEKALRRVSDIAKTGRLAEIIKSADAVARAEVAAAQRAAKEKEKLAGEAVKRAQRVADAEAREAARLEREKVKAAERAADREAKAAQSSAREQNRIRVAEMQAANRLEVEKVKAVEAAERQKVAITERAARERQRAAERAAREAAQAQRSQQGAGAQKAAAAAGGMQSAGGAMVAAGTSMTAALTVPLAAFAKFAIDVGTQYDEAMNMLQVATSANEEQMKRAAQVAVELGADMTLPATSAANAATAMLELGKAGMTIEQSMSAAKGVLQLAAAASIDEARAAEITANALNAFNLEASESTRVADLLAGAANASSAEISDVAAAMQQSSAVFASAKVPIEDLTTMLALMANKGIKGSDAGTSLKTMLMRLQAPTKEAAGAMKKLGVDVFDAQGKLLPFREIIGQFSGSLSQLNDEQKAQALQTIFGADAMRAATIVFGEGAGAFDSLKTAVTKQGAAAEMAAARTKGLGGAWKGLTSQIETLALLIYNQFKGPLEVAVRAVAEVVGQLAERFTAFAQAHPNLVLLAGAFAALLAAAGPVLVVLGGVVMAIGGLVGAVLAIKAGIVALGGVAAVLALTAKLLLALAAVAAVVAVAAVALYVAWQNNLGGIREFAYEVIEALKSAFNAGLKFILDLWAKYGDSIMRTAAQVWDGIAEVAGPALAALVSAARENFGIVVDWVRENWPLISKTVEDVMKYVGERVRYWLTAAQGFWQAHGEQIKNIVSAVWTIIRAVVQTGLRNVLDVIKLTLQLIQGDWAGAWETWKGIVARTWRAIFEIVKASLAVVWNLLKSLAGQIAANVSGMLAAGRDLGKAIVDGIVGGIKSGVNRVTNAAKEMAIWAITGAKVQLDSHSPSKVFWGIGRDVALGFILGIGSMQAEAQETLNRLVIPEDVQAATGKGSAKTNRQRGEADKVNRPGWDLLAKVYQDIDQLAPAGQKTKELEVTAELAGTQYKNLATNIRTALLDAARFYDQRKANLAVGDELNNQLDAAAKKLLEFKYSAKEGASEVERFDLFLAQMRAESPLAAAALDKAADKLAKVREAWGAVDAEEKARKTKEAAAALSKAVSDMADESGVALRDLSTTADTNLEKFLLKLSRLKDLSLDLSQLNPIHDLALSIKELPQEERLHKLAEALERIMRAARPAGMGDADWQKFIADTARGVDNSAQIDAAGQKQKALDLYNKALEDLDGKMGEVNGQLNENNRLTEAARVRQELLRGAYKDLTDEQRQAIVARAGELDQRKREVEEALKMREKLEGLADSITGVFDGALDDLFERGFKGFFKSVVRGFKQMFQQVVKDFLLSGINKLFRNMLGLDTGSGGGSGSGGGGGILDTVGKFFGSIFKPGGASSTQTLSTTTAKQISSFGAGGDFGPSLSTGRPTGAAAADTLTQAVSRQTAQHEALHSAALRQTGSESKGGGFFGKNGFLSGFRSPSGGLSAQGAATALGLHMGLFDSLFGGNARAALGRAGFLAPLVSSPFIAGLPLFGLFQILGRNARRRADERSRDGSMVSSLSSLNELLKAVNQYPGDGGILVSDALTQAAQIRQEYVNAAQALKDKKTRGHALKDVSRLDAVISQIKAAEVGQRDRLEMVANRKPEFAAGGIVPGSLGQPVPMIGHGGEVFVNPGQMAGIGAAVMALAGVPGVNGLPFSVPTVTAVGGSGASGDGGDIVIKELRVGIDAGGIFVRGGRTRDGRRLIVETIVEEQHEGGLER